MPTMRARYLSALLLRGEKQVPSKSSKYLTVTRKGGGFYFIGRSGALRVGYNSSQSLACNDRFKRALLLPLPPVPPAVPVVVDRSLLLK